jgi:hypothetical protein
MSPYREAQQVISHVPTVSGTLPRSGLRLLGELRHPFTETKTCGLGGLRYKQTQRLKKLGPAMHALGFVSRSNSPRVINPLKILDCFLEAIHKRNLGFPLEVLPRLGDVGTPSLRIVVRKAFEDYL